VPLVGQCHKRPNCAAAKSGLFDHLIGLASIRGTSIPSDVRVARVVDNVVGLASVCFVSSHLLASLNRAVRNCLMASTVAL
jgi:hypothetical protein